MVGWMWVKLWKWDRLAVSSGCVKGVEGLLILSVVCVFSTVHPVRSINCLKHLAANCLESMILTKGSPHIFCGCTVKCPNVCRDLLRWWNLTQYASYFDGRLWTRWFKIYQILPHFTFSYVFCAARTRDFKLGNKQLWGGDMSWLPWPPSHHVSAATCPIQFVHLKIWPIYHLIQQLAANPLQFLRRHRGTGRWQCGTGCVSATYRARWARCTAHVAAKSRWAHHIVGEAGGTNLVKHSFPKFNGWNPFEIDDAFQGTGISYVWNGGCHFQRYSWSDQGKVGIAGVQLILLREATWRTEMPWWVYSTGLDDLYIFPTEFSKQMGNLLVGFSTNK